MRPWLAALFVLAGILAGCGGNDDDSASSPGDSEEIKVEADTGPDRKIGEDLKKYVIRNCAEQIPDRVEEKWRERPEMLEMIEAWLEVCSNVREIEVADSRIAVQSGIESGPDSEMIGAAFCNLIQGSDVADFTDGHTLYGNDGEKIKVCRSRN